MFTQVGTGTSFLAGLRSKETKLESNSNCSTSKEAATTLSPPRSVTTFPIIFCCCGSSFANIVNALGSSNLSFLAAGICAQYYP